jgi:hypothetical protein
MDYITKYWFMYCYTVIIFTLLLNIINCNIYSIYESGSIKFKTCK